MKVSELINHLRDYLDMYGDQTVLIFDTGTGGGCRIIKLDAFSENLYIDVETTEEIEEDE